MQRRCWWPGWLLVVPGLGTAQEPATAWGTARVRAVLSAPLLDASAFAALVAGGQQNVPGLLAVLGDRAQWLEPLPPDKSRALRALRLLGPPVADAALPQLADLVARDSSRDDVELLDTMAVLAPGMGDRPAFLAATRSIEITAPRPQLDMPAFRRWVAKMRLWYRFRRCLLEDAPTDTDRLIAQLDDQDPLTRERATRRRWRSRGSIPPAPRRAGA